MSVLFGAPRVTRQDTRPADLESMTKTQLAAMCDERGIDVPKGATKAKLIELLRG